MASSNCREILAQNIRKERIRLDLSQAELAKMINVKNASTIGNWENGFASPDNEKLCFLADIFDVSTDFLLGRSERDGHRLEDAESVEEKELFTKYKCCDEIGQGAIVNCISFHYERCIDELNGFQKKKTNRGDEIYRIFLVEGKDTDYELMKGKIPYLKKLKTHSNRSYIDITKYLWDIGYGDEICLAFVLSIFGIGINKRVPSQKLFREIETFLKHDYEVLPVYR